MKFEGRRKACEERTPHLFGGGVDVVIDLITLETSGDCPRDLLDEVVGYVRAHRDELMEEWKKWH